MTRGNMSPRIIFGFDEYNLSVSKTPSQHRAAF